MASWRGPEVIQAFTPQRPLLSISQISQKTGILRAAARRCLYTLSKLGFVHAEDGKNFSCGRGSWRWATPGWLPDAAGAFGAAAVWHLSEMLNESCPSPPRRRRYPSISPAPPARGL